MALWGRGRLMSGAIRAEADRSARIDDYVAEQLGPNDPGLALAVVQSAKVVHSAGYGLADVGKGVPVAHDTIFHLASCGKQFTAFGVLLLVADGKLQLDDPLSRHLPALSGFGEDLLIRHLLNHTSGIRDLYDDKNAGELLARSKQPTNADMIRAYAELGFPMAHRRQRPGDAFAYSNPGYDLLGSVIQQVSGQSYGDFFQARVFGPLRMKDTFSVPSARIKDPRCAAGYELDGRSHLAETHGSDFDGLLGSGSFYTTVPDLCRYEQALRNNELLDDEIQIEAFISGETNDGKPTNYGFGWFIGEYNGLSLADHEGSWNGYYSYICCFMEEPLSLFVLTNNPKIDLQEVANIATDAFTDDRVA